MNAGPELTYYLDRFKGGRSLAAMLDNQMIIVSGGGAFGANTTTEGDSDSIDDRELAADRDLGKRVAEVAVLIKLDARK